MKKSIPLLLLIGFLLSASGNSALEKYKPLLEDSPFLSLAFKERIAQTGSADSRNLEFSGYAWIDDAWHLCIFDKSKSTTHWVQINETVTGFTVTEFDPEENTILLEKSSVTVTLKLETP